MPKDNSAQFRVKFTNIIGRHELSYGGLYQKNLYTLNFQDSGPTDWVSPENGLTTLGGGFSQWTQRPAAGPTGSWYRYRLQDYFTTASRATEGEFTTCGRTTTGPSPTTSP